VLNLRVTDKKYHSPPSSAKVKNVWSCTSTSHSPSWCGAFTLMKIHIMGFWVVKPHCDVVGYWCFEGPCCLHLQVKVEAARSSEKLLPCHIIKRCHNPEDHDFNTQWIWLAIFYEIILCMDKSIFLCLFQK